MKMASTSVSRTVPTTKAGMQATIAGPHHQNGVVLVIALVLLVVISLLAVTSLRNAGSAEKIAGNVRVTELATQAAEIALRHCESSAIQLARDVADTHPAYYSTTLVITSISPISSALWQSTTTWDSGTSTATFILPTSTFAVGGTTTYKRPPECMVELVSGSMPVAGTTTTPSAFVITARGFGPEVDAGTGRPQGSEVWLQSTIEIP